MGKPSCKEKRTFHTEEEVRACTPQNIDYYQCRQCGYYHLTSTGKKTNSKRYNEYKWKKKKRR